MTVTQIASGPAHYAGPFHPARSLGIDRAGYIAIHAEDPAAAAAFAAENLGFFLVHVDDAGRHYLAAHGLDTYSIVYTPGPTGAVDHISYVVRHAADLGSAQERLTASGVAVERVESSPLWRHGPALRVTNPSGQVIELTTGASVGVPVAQRTSKPTVAPAPITFDHAIVNATDLEAGYEFASRVLGLKESGRVLGPDGPPLLGFFRGGALYHCYGLALWPSDGLNHIQFTVKDTHAVYAAAERLEQAGIRVLFGPVRHGAGHNVAIYFHDATGTVIEYSAEEEIILDDEHYSPQIWEASDGRAINEWNETLPPAEMRP